MKCTCAWVPTLLCYAYCSYLCAVPGDELRRLPHLVALREKGHEKPRLLVRVVRRQHLQRSDGALVEVELPNHLTQAMGCVVH